MLLRLMVVLQQHSTLQFRLATLMLGRTLHIYSGGGVINYLIYLTESLKSFAGRRWVSYAEPQEITDEVVRTGELSNNIDNIEPVCFGGIRHEVGRLPASVIWHGDSGRRLLYQRSYTCIALQCSSSAKRGILRDSKSWNYRINKHNHTSALSRSRLTSASERGWLCA